MKHRIVISAFLALALGAGAADWFDAGISGYTQWPSDGSDFLVPGAGTWTGTANAKLVSSNGLSRLNVMTHAPEDALAFSPEVAKDMADNLLFRVTATFCLFCELPNADPSFKTALTALEKKNGQVVYCGFVADGDSGTNCWAELSGATPAANGCRSSWRTVPIAFPKWATSAAASWPRFRRRQTGRRRRPSSRYLR